MELIPLDPENRISGGAFLNEKCDEMYSVYSDYYKNIGFHPPWIGYFVFGDGKVKGMCGFTGAPVDGKVEIAYYTFEDFQGSGVATKAASLLMQIVKNQDFRLNVFAKTAPAYNASTTILKKLGFSKTGVVQDHEIGDAWLWEYESI